MCQQIVFGTDYGPRKFVLGSGAAFLCKKPLFYGPVESYFAAYDSVVLTGPRSGSPAGAITRKIVQRSLRGSAARGRSSSRRLKISRSKPCNRQPTSQCTRAVGCIP